MIKELSEIFTEFEPEILFAYIFGSTDTPSQNQMSDLDIAVYINTKSHEIGFSHKANLYTQVSRATKRNDIDIVILNICSNYMLLYEVLTKGRLVYDSDPEKRLLFEQKTLHAAIDFKEQRERIMA